MKEEEKIYDKLIKQSDLNHVHIAPHALYTAVIFSILTRLEELKNKVPIFKKLRLYNGESVEGFKGSDIEEL